MDIRAKKAEIYDLKRFKKKSFVFSLTSTIALVAFTYPCVKILSMLLILTLPATYYTSMLLYINLKIQGRKEKIDQNLYILYPSMLGLAKSGMNLKDIIYEVSKLGIEEISKEFAKIHAMVEYSGATLKSAILEVALYTPSEKLGDFLRGLVGVSEAGGDLSRYIEDKLRILEVERRILFANYLKKLEVLAEIYTTVIIAIPITVVSLYLARSVSGQTNPTSIYGIIYVFMPLSTACIIFALHTLNPERGENRGLKFLLIIPLSLLVGFAFYYALKNKVLLFAAATIGCIVSWILVRSYIREEKLLSEQLPNYFEKVLSLVEAGKDTTTAFVMAADEAQNPLRKYVSVFSEMIVRGVPRSKAFEWLMKRAPQKDIRVVSKILSKTVEISGKTFEVLLTISNELIRLNSFRTERDSLAKLYGAIMIALSLTFFGIVAMIKVSLLGKLKMGSVSPIKSILDNACLIVGISASLGYAAIRGDFRHLPVPMLVTMLGLILMEVLT